MPSDSEGIFYFRPMDLEQLKYPIGKFEKPETISADAITEAIRILQIFPEQLKQRTYSLKEETLDMPYRPGGWTIRQLIHHIADSHHHCYNRIRWTLTEDSPTIKAYDQDAFGDMYDYKHAPIAFSMSHIEALHQKIVYILNQSSPEEWDRKFSHPEWEGETDLKTLTLLYAWHSMHHFAHIRNALNEVKGER